MMNIFDSVILNDLLLSVLISSGFNLIFYIIAVTLQTDKVTDFTYSLTFIVIAAYQLLSHTGLTIYNMIPALLTILWALRLGSYLFVRIMRIGHDKRFNEMRSKPLRFAGFWLIQTVTVWVVSIPVVLFYSLQPVVKALPVSVAGVIIWLAGMGIETVSDIQKYKFKNNPANNGQWIESGLWHYSRHPNFFGEALLWWGAFLYIAPQLSGWSRLGVIGPLFITLLLRYVSGVPVLERSADTKYGDNQAYRAYKSRTNLLVPWFVK